MGIPYQTWNNPGGCTRTLKQSGFHRFYSSLSCKKCIVSYPINFLLMSWWNSWLCKLQTRRYLKCQKHTSQKIIEKTWYIYIYICRIKTMFFLPTGGFHVGSSSYTKPLWVRDYREQGRRTMFTRIPQPTPTNCFFCCLSHLAKSTSWWLNQPVWKICSSKWESSPSRDEH